jgi:tellurite resistance protein
MPDGSGHLTRDEAFLLVGLLVADADGRRLPVEVQTILDALQTRHVRADDFARVVVQEKAARVRAHGLDALLREVTGGLPSPSDRRWAFGLAVEVAFADRFLHPSEVDHIADLGDALGLDEHEVFSLVKH